MRTLSLRARALASTCVVLLGCAPSSATRPARTPATTTAADPAIDPMQGAPKEALPWADFSAATFARAKAERRFVVLDAAAEWCHWCHVMEATTYHDPRVQKLLGARFVQVKVDVDSRPDLEERYGDYGWPATVIFSPDAEELGKYRGYLEPSKLLEILQAVVDGPPTTPSTATAAVATNDASALGPLPEEAIAWIARFTEVELAEYYDDEQGGWGRSQKAALAWDNAWALGRARAGDAALRSKVLFTLDQQRALLDPVWGGLYQYSAGADWTHPHFEKLMTFQAGALDNYASAYALTHEARYLDAARAMRRYIDRFLRGGDGTFYATQDADLNAHQPGARFLNGHDYYALDEAHRLAAGLPRVDTHAYGNDNALAIAAYVTLNEATGDASALAEAETAARRVLATHASARGGITHDAAAHGPAGALLHLADNAAMGFALMRLHDATRSPEWLRAARGLADFLLKDLFDERAGGFFASTVDPDAVGVFAVRRKPFEDDVMAIRFLARLHAASPDARYAHAIGATLRAIATPEEIKARGRMLGDFLLALEESKAARTAH